MSEQVEVRSDAFMCRCNDEGRATADAVLARAREILGKHSPVKDDHDFVNRAIVWLALDGNFTFMWDQWGAIVVKPFEKHPSKNITESAHIQCDEPIDGLAAAIVHYYGDNSIPEELA